MSTKLFDLHFEVGMNGPPTGDFYAITVLGINNIFFSANGNSPAEAVNKVAIDMERSGMWPPIAKNPQLSGYPFHYNTSPPQQAGNAVPVAKVIQPKKKDPDAPKQLPSHLTSVDHPECTTMCTSFDHFGRKKCKSICGQRSGI